MRKPILAALLTTLVSAAVAAKPARTTPATVTVEAGPAAAATNSTSSSTATAPSAGSPVTVIATEGDSSQTREALRTVLQHYPPEVGMVLKLDPTLMTNQSYIANYPALADFLARHPEVIHSPASFLQGIPGINERDANYPLWRQIMGDVGGFCVFLIFTGVLVWAIRTLLEHRRWNRVSAIQTEVHSKLLDRFTSNEELLAYVQSPAGRRFLEAIPSAPEGMSRAMGAPLGRIFWSVQAGLVLFAGGIALDIASVRMAGGASEATYALALLAICVGVAFIVSAGVFYLLTRRLGVWRSAASGEASET